MIGILGTVYPNPEKVEEVRAGLLEFAEDIKKNEPGCTRYKVVEEVNPKDGTAVFHIIEEYTDQAAIDHHFQTDTFKALGARIHAENLLSQPLVTKIVKVIGGYDGK